MGNGVLKKHLEKCPKNATYRSKTIQNQIIEIIGQTMQEQIIDEVIKAGAFSLLADEATDISNKEQLPVVVRYVDADGEIQEKFLGFYECQDGVRGEDIANLVLTTAAKLGLDMSKCRGQCYDGAGNMAGKVKGAAT